MFVEGGAALGLCTENGLSRDPACWTMLTLTFYGYFMWKLEKHLDTRKCNKINKHLTKNPTPTNELWAYLYRIFKHTYILYKFLRTTYISCVRGQRLWKILFILREILYIYYMNIIFSRRKTNTLYGKMNRLLYVRWNIYIF